MSKNLKKIFAIMLALCLTLGLTTVAFADETNGTEEAARLLGDVNDDGKVAAVDARIVLRASAALHKEGIDLKDVTSEDFWTADVDADNRISAVDARRILRVSARLDDFAGVPTFETKTQINAITAAITTALDDISVADKNLYYNDVIDSIAAELAPHFDETDTVEFERIVTFFKAIEFGQVDWDNANMIIEAIAPKVLAWANAADVAAIAGMIADAEADSNDVVDFVVDALFTDDAIKAVLGSLEDDGLLDSLKAAIEILDEAGILVTIYNAYIDLPDALTFDDFDAAKAALIEELDYLAGEYPTVLAAIDGWLVNTINLEDTDFDAVRVFIAGIFKNEPVEDLEELDIDAIVTALVANLAATPNAEKEAYVYGIVDAIADALEDVVDADTLALVVGVIKGMEIGEADWNNLNAIVSKVLPAVLEWANEDDIAALADMIEEGATHNAVITEVVEMLLTDEVITGVFGFLKEEGLEKSLFAAVEVLDTAGILEAIYEAYIALPGALEFDNFAHAKAELIEEIEYLADKYPDVVTNINNYLGTAIDDEYKTADVRAFVIALFSK